jgi:Zn-dependent protease
MSFLSSALNIILSLVAVFTAIVLHEVSHGYVAFRLGDPTPRQRGRLTLNPLAHIDPIGTILVPLVLVLFNSPILFGWAKPVPINPNYFRNPFKGMLYVAIAGPLTNIALAVVSAGIGRLILSALSVSLPIGNTFGANLMSAGFYLLGVFVIMNVILAVFNMIPIPPLDGSRVLTYFLPPGGRRIMIILERYGFLIIVGLLMLGAIQGLFSLVSGLWQGLLGEEWLYLIVG